MNSDGPSIFYEDAEGKTHRYTEKEFVKVFAKWAQSDKNKTNVRETPFDDSSWWSHDGYEETINEAGDGAKFGHGQNRDANYSTTYISSRDEFGVSDPHGGSHRTVSYGNYEGDFVFKENLSNSQAALMYDSMYELANRTATGALESMIDPDIAPGVNMFETPDLDQFMRGVDVANMTPGDVAKNPTYTQIIDPFQLTPDAIDMLKNVHDVTQVNSFQTVTYMDDVPFNESQMGDSVQDDNSEILDPGDEVNAKNFTAADALLKDYFMQLRRMQGPTPTKSKYPTATIKYYPAWSSDAHDLTGGKAGYAITFGEDYLEQYRKAGGILDGLTGSMEGKTAVLNIVIDKDQDKNNKRQGEMNFSSVAAQISSSSNGGYQDVVPLGGSLNIVQDHNGQYEIAYEVIQFDAETAGEGTGWSSAIERKLMTDNEGNPINALDRRYLDYYTDVYVNALQQTAKYNKADRDAWKKANPDKVIDDPNYLYKFN